MAKSMAPRSSFHAVRELVVPALMLGGAAAYVYDSRGLSLEALILPLALVAVIGASLLMALVQSFARPGDGGDPAQEPILEAKPWLLVLCPTLLVAAWAFLGALAALVALVFCAQLVLEARAPLRALLVAIAIAVPSHAVFQYFLYVRFPRGVLGLG
jgi:hypothetical protein